MKKNILITGGGGFIGSNLANYLAKKNFKVIVIDDLSVGDKRNLNKNRNIKFLKKNINQISSIKLKEKIDCCIHLAAKAQILINTKEARPKKVTKLYNIYMSLLDERARGTDFLILILLIDGISNIDITFLLLILSALIFLRAIVQYVATTYLAFQNYKN